MVKAETVARERTKEAITPLLSMVWLLDPWAQDFAAHFCKPRASQRFPRSRERGYLAKPNPIPKTKDVSSLTKSSQAIFLATYPQALRLLIPRAERSHRRILHFFSFRRLSASEGEAFCCPGPKPGPSLDADR